MAIDNEKPPGPLGETDQHTQEYADEQGPRRKSVALNIVQNPLKVNKK